MIGYGPTVIVVHPSVLVNTLGPSSAVREGQPVARVERLVRPGPILHPSYELFAHKTGTQLLHAPYKGAVPASTDLLGGQVQAMFDSISNARAPVRAGKLKALAVLDAGAHPAAAGACPPPTRLAFRPGRRLARRLLAGTPNDIKRSPRPATGAGAAGTASKLMQSGITPAFMAGDAFRAKLAGRPEARGRPGDRGQGAAAVGSQEGAAVRLRAAEVAVDGGCGHLLARPSRRPAGCISCCQVVPQVRELTRSLESAGIQGREQLYRATCIGVAPSWLATLDSAVADCSGESRPVEKDVRHAVARERVDQVVVVPVDQVVLVLHARAMRQMRWPSATCRPTLLSPMSDQAQRRSARVVSGSSSWPRPASTSNIAREVDHLQLVQAQVAQAVVHRLAGAGGAEKAGFRDASAHARLTLVTITRSSA